MIRVVLMTSELVIIVTMMMTMLMWSVKNSVYFCNERNNLKLQKCHLDNIVISITSTGRE